MVHISGATRIRVIVILILIFIIWQIMKYWNELELEKKNAALLRPSGAPVVVAVYYEALCPDSKHFIIKQLHSTYQRAPNLMSIEFIPYGKASTSTNPDGSLKFSCQHGRLECEANIIHACAIESIYDPEIRLNVIACMIEDNMKPEEALARCAKEYDVSTDQIRKCYENPHGAEILKVHGDATNALRPKMAFVPTITLDGLQHNQAYILKDLFTEVCKVSSGKGIPPEVCEK